MRWVKLGLWLIVPLLFVLLLISVFNRVGCYWYGYQTDREVRYAPFVGCMVKVHDQWFPRNELRVAQ